MPTYHMPERKLETALKAILDGLGLALPVEVRFGDDPHGEDDEVASERIVVAVLEATPEIFGETITGNWTCEASLEVVTLRGETSGEDHDGLVGAIADVLFSDDLVDQLNAAGEEMTVDQAFPGPRRNSIGDGTRLTTQALTVHMAPSDMSAN